MRVMIKFTFAADSGNDLIRSGKIGQIFERISQEIKPECAYFFPDNGNRAGLMVFDMERSSQVAEVAERFFLGLNAKVEMTPVMAPEDLQASLSNMQSIVDSYR